MRSRLSYVPAVMDAETRGLLESDRAFPNFIGPISNPILTKDPRSLTELRPLFGLAVERTPGQTAC